MVAHLMRMKLAITVNGWKRSTLHLVMSIFLIAYLVLVLAMWGVGAAFLPDLEVQWRGTVLTLAGAAAVLGWIVIPVFFTGVDMTLDPANFATFGIPSRTLVPGLALAGLVTVPGAATLIAYLLSSLAWRDSWPALITAIPTAILGALFCICVSYAVTGLLAAFTGRRRIREIVSIIALVPLMLSGVILSGIVDSVEAAADRLPEIAAIIAWTPLGSFTAAPWAAAEGRYGEAVGQGLLCLAWVAGAVWLWQLAVNRSYTQARGSGSAARASKAGLGLLGRLPGTPAGAIAARSIIYWLKDPRYSASLMAVPLMLVLFWFLGSQSGDYSLMLFMGPVTGFMLGYAISADIAYDSSAFALHVTAGVSGRDDRVGRVGALLLWALPLTLVLTLATTWMAGTWDLLPGLIGLAAGALLTGAGVSAVSSARFIYPVPKPGDSPFATPEGSAMRMLLVSLGSMVVLGLLVLPELILFVVALLTGNILFQWLTLVVGLGLGLSVLWLGIRWGSRWFDRAQAETYQSVLKFA
ncbi:MAG: Tat (twin-arginine translocation) pathway signal sequence [Citricoccus sp.]|nr:Tat (twin-arginine translocation) pathway signal sequence [Citricoccus sp. WCRC_4]